MLGLGKSGRRYIANELRQFRHGMKSGGSHIVLYANGV
jgi:hypothetical protein